MLLELEPDEQLNLARRRNRRTAPNPVGFTTFPAASVARFVGVGLSTAGGLVCTSGSGGLLTLDARSGKPIWNAIDSLHRAQNQ